MNSTGTRMPRSSRSRRRKSSRSPYRALLAGAAEYWCREFGLQAPAWIEEPQYFLDDWWTPWGEFLSQEPERVAARRAKADPAFLRRNGATSEPGSGTFAKKLPVTNTLCGSISRSAPGPQFFCAQRNEIQSVTFMRIGQEAVNNGKTI